MLQVVAGAILSARGLLLVSKRAAPAVFYLPGGKPEADESAEACLRRELREELRVEVRTATPLLDVRAPAALERVEMEMMVFLTAVRGEPTAGAEISRLAWWPERMDLKLAPAVRDAVIPQLLATGRLATDRPDRLRSVIESVRTQDAELLDRLRR